MTRSIRLVAALLAAGSAALAPAMAEAASTTPSSVTAMPGSASATVRWQAPATVDGRAGGLGQVSLVPYEIERGGIAVRDVVSPG